MTRGTRQGLDAVAERPRRIHPFAIRAAAIMLALVPVLGGCGGGNGPDAPAPAGAACAGFASPAARTETYREDSAVAAKLRSLDVYAPARDPACPPAPVVVYFHGGGYVTGDKARQVADKAALFAREGWVFVSANYRLSPYPTELGNPGRIRYPAAQHDAAAALAWVRGQAARLRIDPARLMLMGHSAGGHLVTLVSADEQFLAAQGMTRADLRCTVSLDTEAYDLPTLVQDGGDALGLYRNAVGTDPATLQAASPLRHVRAGAPAHWIVTRGSASRQAQAREHARALQAVSVSAGLLVARGYSHEEVNDAVGRPGERVITPPLMDFLRSCAA